MSRPLSKSFPHPSSKEMQVDARNFKKRQRPHDDEAALGPVNEFGKTQNKFQRKSSFQPDDRKSLDAQTNNKKYADSDRFNNKSNSNFNKNSPNKDFWAQKKAKQAELKLKKKQEMEEKLIQEILDEKRKKNQKKQAAKKLRKWGQSEQKKLDEEKQKQIGDNVVAIPTTTTENSVEQEQDDPAIVENDLVMKYMMKMKGGCFRLLNELFCSSKSDDSLKYFQKYKEMFDVYHQGFVSQAKKWPVNPLQFILKELQTYKHGWPDEEATRAAATEDPQQSLSRSRSNAAQGIPEWWRVADMGCGDGDLALGLLDNKVYSYDLVSRNPRVTVADIAHLPLPDKSVELAILCLALLGVNWLDYIREAYRILIEGGLLKVAEVTSRIAVPLFIQLMKFVGFVCVRQENISDVIILFDFKKGPAPQDSNIILRKMHLEEILTPFRYKKR